MTGALVAGLLAGYGVAVPIGAVAVLVASLAARTSLGVGCAGALGVATADGLYALLAVAGGVALARELRPVSVPMRWVAAAVLVCLATRVGTSAWRHRYAPAGAVRTRLGTATAWRAYGGLLGITLLNPATVVYFAALVLGRQSGTAPSGAAPAVFVVAVFAASASWQLLIAVGGSLLGRVLAGPRGRLGSALVSSVLIVVLAIWLAPIG